MSAAAVEEPMEQPTLLEAAELISNQFAGHRVEIVGSQITVTPLPKASHGKSLSRLMRVLFAAGLDGDEVDVLQNVGIWLPTGPSDYAVPDLSIADSDIDDHLIEYNCYDPAVFRLVLEVTSSNLSDDLKRKPTVYATAGVPVYVIVDRTNQRVMVLTEPQDDEYRVHAVHHRGQSFTLPESIGAPVTLAVDDVLAAKK
ncbi:Uma2 family endonuclease [Streptomyces sp. 1331.2]|uniref:Uma2 family endonuclease n=1 Tax=Streptomyces sp. 1331.2 TaxID=1938835 RepID=UPI000BD26B79|nr:Uma2 family endonuclease [Streptomyces sp. 1331.2]SOB84997.1 Endonuclease, Uma2 family (restriction endonuclease fold) [Streptomyces sp. 1331.2]